MPTTADYEKFFKDADADGSGELTFEEIQAMLKKNGYKLTTQEVKRQFKAIDISGDGKITKEEYMTAMGCVAPVEHGSASMRRVFNDFDKDGNGTIDREELDQVFREMGKHFSKAELDRMIQLVDKDGSGNLDYEEFIAHVFGK